jgi:hypothetical protein
MQIMSELCEKIEAYEERAEKRLNSWLDRARHWQQEGQ